MDASVGFPQSFDDLQSVQQLVWTFNPQQLLPAETLPILKPFNPVYCDSAASRRNGFTE